MSFGYIETLEGNHHVKAGDWIITDVRGSGAYNNAASYICRGCGAIGRGHEHPQITRGRRVAGEFKNVPVMDKRMTRLQCNVQIGILRELHRTEVRVPSSLYDKSLLKIKPLLMG